MANVAGLNNIDSREFAAFVDDCNGTISKKVHDQCAIDKLTQLNTSVQTLQSGPLSGVVWDWFTLVEFDSVTDDFLFYSGGPSGTLAATVRVIYADGTKCKAIAGGRL